MKGGNKKVIVKSTLSRMTANLEWKTHIQLPDREMTAEEVVEYIDRYLEHPNLVNEMYQGHNITEFSWDREDMDWDFA